MVTAVCKRSRSREDACMRLPRSSALITVLVLSASLAGPSVAGRSAYAATNPAVRLQSVASETAAAKTMTFGMNMAIIVIVGGKTVTGSMIGSGQTDRTNRASSFSLDMSDFMKAMAVGSGRSFPPAFSDPAQLTMRVISLGNRVWMSYPLLNTMVGGAAPTKPWVVLDAGLLGVNAGDLAASQGADPTQGLDLLRGLSDTAKDVGTELIDGAKTTKYEGSITAEALTKNLPKAQAGDVVKLMGADRSVPVAVWIDEQNRARRLELTFRTARQGGNMTLKAAYSFSKFGEPVSISAPPASQVAENGVFINSLVRAAKARKKAA